MREQSQQPSDYQQDCFDFYHLLRGVHTDAHLNPKRTDDELTKRRYTDANHSSIRNLNTFFEILHRLTGDGPNVCGVDYGCGSHWFVDRVRNQYGWSAVGYDPDAEAIRLAKARFPATAEFYRCRNPLEEGLPEADESQTFVMSNAVLQHFNDEEVECAIAEMSRVIRPGGYCLLVFKRWTSELATGEDPISGMTEIVDMAGHKVLFDDPTMRKAIDVLNSAKRDTLAPERRTGRRLLHLFDVDQITEIAARVSLRARCAPGGDGSEFPEVLTYRSGKGVPTATLYLEKLASDE